VARGANAIGVKPARQSLGAPVFLTADKLSANFLPSHRGSRAMRRRSVRFAMPTPWQFLLLDAPEIRRAFLFERRVLIVRVARALVDGNICSLNSAAKLLDVPASSLCVMLQKYRAGGDESLLPKIGKPGTATSCRLSFFIRTQ